jgi:hypothetical protein
MPTIRPDATVCNVPLLISTTLYIEKGFAIQGLRSKHCRSNINVGYHMICVFVLLNKAMDNGDTYSQSELIPFVRVKAVSFVLA